MKKIVGLGASTLVAGAAMAAMSSVVLISPTVAHSAPGTSNSVNVVGETYAKAVAILKSQGIRQRFNGSFAGDIPQSQCVVDQQKAASNGVMLLHLDCTEAAASAAADNSPAPSAPAGGPGAPSPGNGQGTYGGPIGVPVPVG